MRITARCIGKRRFTQKRGYLIGGGFIVEEERFVSRTTVVQSVPYDFHSASANC